MTNTNAPWFPTIYTDKCDGCTKTGHPRCIEFCQNEVFAFQDGKAVVVNPANCVPNCSACAPLCPKKAISFPSMNNVNTQVKQEDKNLLRKTTCKICKKTFWTNTNRDVCFDCEK